MTTPDTSAATSSRSGQLSGAMSSDTPEHFISHSPARPVAGEATPGLLRPTDSVAGGSTHSPVAEAMRAYDDVFKAYTKAVTLCQTRLVGQIYPALVTARNRLTQAELEAEGVHGTKRRVLGWSV